ncbi:MAG TPA: hypothetical protein P5205_18020 [Candidatus Paceibacterota bacterium]|nr:hypothetical protein [Verrucomicrobiota bacterium]HSA12261.1 hypothetical protein [Candidatus Paceibacterota bacterium]
MKNIFALALPAITACIQLAHAHPATLDHVAPTLAQLGEGWTSPSVVVLLDQRDPTNTICTEGEGWLKAAHNVVGKRGRDAYMVLRYTYQSRSVLVWMNRCKDPQSIGDDWGKDPATKTTLDPLPKVGDEVRYYKRDGMHENIAFRRDNYLVDVEGVNVPIAKLEQLAIALDSNLIKAHRAPAPPPAGEKPGSITFTGSGTVQFENLWAKDPEITAAAKEFGFKSQGSNTMFFTIAVSNSCYDLRLTPTKPDPIHYHEAAFDGHTLYFLSHMNTADLQNDPRLRGKPNVATAWIYGHQQVVYSLFAHQMGPIWLMLASGHYLRSVTNGLIQPPLTLGLFENDDYFPRPFTIPARWTLQQAFPFLPLEVTCRDGGETKTAPPFQNAKRETPFNAGFTNIVFRVTGTREFDGIQVPSSAQLDTYRPALPGKPELRPYTRYRLTLTEWRKGFPRISFIPKLPGLTTISDTRASAGVAPKTTTSDEWPR